MRRPARVNGVRHHAHLGGELGFTLVEVLVSLVIVLAVAGGMAGFYGVSARANNNDRLNVQLLNSARAKIEQIQSIPYSQVGIVAAGSAAGPGYFVRDPYYVPVYDPASGDVLLSDTVTLSDGTQVTRTVIIEAIDDAADGTGGSDSDGVVEPNTETILDYKLVTVTASATNQAGTLQQRLTTILQGALAVEVEGATGKDAENPPGKLGKVPKTSPLPPEPPPADCNVTDPPDGKGPGKKGTGKQSEC